MSRSIDKDYRYLLAKLLPRHLLSSQRVDKIFTALSGADRFEMVRQAYLSMEELTASGDFHRNSVRHSIKGSSISYKQADGRSRITLEMTGEEWEVLTGAARREAGVLPTVLAGIISALSLNNAPKTFVGKLEGILDLAGHIQRDCEAYLILFHEVAGINGGRIRVATQGRVQSSEFYRSCITGRIKHLFLPVDEDHRGSPVFHTKPETKSIILVPLFAGDKKWGILEVHTRQEDSPGDEVFLNYDLLGQGIVRLLQNNRLLERMVSIDTLTKVYNRNYYESQLSLEMERAIRNKKYLALLVIDVDDFKSINDRFGHDVGDEVLRHVAQTFKKHLRKIDLLFRYGGEEFIVLLPGAGKEAAERTAERIREKIAGYGFRLQNGEDIKVTISIGGCIYPADAQSEAELFKRADSALYVSKSQGKDTVTFYDSGLDRYEGERTGL